MIPGCFHKLLQLIEENAVIIAAVALGIAALEVQKKQNNAKPHRFILSATGLLECCVLAHIDEPTVNDLLSLQLSLASERGGAFSSARARYFPQKLINRVNWRGNIGLRLSGGLKHDSRYIILLFHNWMCK